MAQEIFIKGGKKTIFTTQEVHFVFKINKFNRAEGDLKEYHAFIQDLNNKELKHEIKTYKAPNGNWFNFDPFIDKGDPQLIQEFREKINEHAL